MSGAVLFQTMPPLSVEEYGNLEKSIRDHGIQVPVLVDEEGVVIDGHHRQKIAASLGIDCPTEPRYGLSESEKRSLSISLNIDRRQLSREQRRSIIESSLKADPALSNREHARRVGVDHKTVEAIRAPLVGRGEIPHVEERTDSLGRQQPASKPDRPVTKFTDTPKEEIFVDTETGEIVDAPVTTTETHTVKTVVGLDGKNYPQTTTSTPRRSPLIDETRNAGWQIRKAAERLERIAADDRFAKNKVEILAALQPHLDFVNETISGLGITAYTNEEK